MVSEIIQFSTHPPLMSSLGFMVNAFARLLRMELERRLSPAGLTPTTWVVLSSLNEGESLSQSELVRRTFLDAATMTRALDVLEARGSITRTRDESDRRVQIIQITKKGSHLLDQVAKVGPNVSHEMTTVLNDDEREQMAELLRRLLYYHQSAGTINNVI